MANLLTVAVPPFRLAKLTDDFQRDFSDPSVPSLPQILSTISTSASKQSDFFSSVVRSKDLIPLYHDIVIWMLKRDMLITLHLCIRVVATQDLKMRVRLAREQAGPKRAKAGGRGARRTSEPRSREDIGATADNTQISTSGTTWVSFSPKSARKYSRRFRSNSGDSNLSDLVLKESDGEQSEGEEDVEGDGDGSDDEDDDGEEEEWEEEEEDEHMHWDNRENYLLPTMIHDPGRATPLQRRWLSAMSEGKDASVARRFEQ